MRSASRSSMWSIAAEDGVSDLKGKNKIIQADLFESRY